MRTHKHSYPKLDGKLESKLHLPLPQEKRLKIKSVDAEPGHRDVCCFANSATGFLRPLLSHALFCTPISQSVKWTWCTTAIQTVLLQQVKCQLGTNDLLGLPNT